MAATFLLVGCLLAPAQTPLGPAPGAPATPSHRDWAVAVRLAQAQELLYRGVFTEEAHQGGVQFARAYRMETRLFVLDSSSRGAQVALLTVVKAKDSRPAQEAGAGAARLERVLIAP